MRRDKGFGPALGTSRAPQCALCARGFVTASAPSDWHIPRTALRMQRALIDGAADAARNARPAHADAITDVAGGASAAGAARQACHNHRPPRHTGPAHREDDAMLLGAIADDFTGATDLCSMLVRGGMRTVQLIGVPRPGDPAPDADAVVVALKSRTAPVRQAVDESLAALDLAARGRLPAVLLQVLLHLRQHRRRQHRPGRRCADRGTRLRLRARLSGVPGECAQRLSGPSVRRRHAAERERHGAPSADADDRRQPGARAVAADRRHGRAWSRSRPSNRARSRSARR